MRIDATRLMLATILFSVVSFESVRAQVAAGISLGKEGIEGFYIAVGEHYKVPEREVIIVREKRIPDEELPVIFFLARRARVAPSVVMNLRLSGKSWMDITLHFGLSPEIYYVPVKRNPGPPYGKAYGYFKKKPRKQWKTIVLADVDVINFVNLRFTSEHYGYSPDEVIRMRAEGKNFVEIHDHIKKAKRAKPAKGATGAGKKSGKK